jgi:hypothetical protein
MFDTIWDFIKAMTVPMALVAIALAIVFLGFASIFTSPMGMVVSAVVVAGVLYWYWTREPSEPSDPGF